jgi:hypothetical protein
VLSKITLLDQYPEQQNNLITNAISVATETSGCVSGKHVYGAILVQAWISSFLTLISGHSGIRFTLCF